MDILKIRILVAFYFTVVIASCSKTTDQDPIPPKKTCQILSTVVTSPNYSDTTVFTYRYNSDGKIIEMICSGPYPFTTDYTYNGNLIYRAVHAGINSSVDTITLKDWGKIARLKEVTSQGTYYIAWEYNSAHELIKYSSAPDSNTWRVITYTNLNGDGIKQLNDTVVTTFEYDLNKPAVQGSLDDFERLNLGAPASTNKHLLVKADNFADHLVYSYTYTPEGNIATLTTTNHTSIQVFTYSYECK